MIISQIVAVSLNHVIGVNNRLPWHMPDDSAYFREKTLGHHVVMGRRNYEAEGKALSGRVNIVLTRNKDYSIKDGIIVHHLEDAIEIARKAGETELFIVGGAEIYKLAMPVTDKIYLTRIDVMAEGDTFYPELGTSTWKEVSRIQNSKNQTNPYDFDYLTYQRR